MDPSYHSDLAFYATPGRFTELGPDIEATPSDPRHLRAIVAGQIRHFGWAWAYPTPLPDPTPAELNTRSAVEMIHLVQQKKDRMGAVRLRRLL